MAGSVIGLLKQGLRIIGVVAALLLLTGSHVTAHSDFEGSEPADGSVINELLDSVVLNFAVPVLSEGASVIAVGADSGVVTEGVITEISGTSWRASFIPALQGEVVRVAFAFRAEDGHLVEAEVLFDLTAATTTSIETSTTIVFGDVEVGDVVPAGGTPSATATTGTTPSVTQGEAAGDSNEVQVVEVPPASDVFSLNEGVNHVARLTQNVLGFALVGGVYFALYLWRRGELLPAPRLIGAMAAVLGVASFAEIVTIAGQLDISVSDALTHTLGRSALMTLCASLLFVIAAASVVTGQVTSRSAFRLTMLVPSLGIVGAPAFDGHAVTKGPRIAHALSDIVHMGSAMIWVGAVLGLALVARVDEASLTEVARRTAKALAGTVVVVAVSGVAMTLMILDGFSSLTDSTWGRILIVKLVVVGAAGVIGAVHHWRIVPQLELIGSRRSFRRSVALECVVLVAVIATSSWLVVAMP
jgi:putative copper export protein/methionine-rich copper-binding protein CopC